MGLERDILHGECSTQFEWIKRDLIFRISFYLLTFLVVIKFLNFNLKRIGIDKLTTGQIREILIWGLFGFILVSIYIGNQTDKRCTIEKDVIIMSVYFFFVNAFFEELIYRAIIQNILTQFILFPLNIIIASIIFGIQHRLFFGCSYKRCLFFGSFGLFVGFIYYKTNSLTEVWLIHGFADLGLTWGRHIYYRLTNK